LEKNKNLGEIIFVDGYEFPDVFCKCVVHMTAK
jgi:hypothetical protein